VREVQGGKDRVMNPWLEWVLWSVALFLLLLLLPVVRGEWDKAVFPAVAGAALVMTIRHRRKGE
jgi:hypothetical protein